MTGNVTPFVVGTQGYIWGRLTSGGPAEWILLTASAWRWPNDDPLAFSVTWSTTSADEAIVGTIDPDGEIYPQTGRVEAAAVPQRTAEIWRELHFDVGEATDPSISGWESDPDGDGVSNHLDYAISSNPRRSDASLGPWEISGEEDALVVTQPRNPNRADVSLVAEFSENLQTWSTTLPALWTLLADDSSGQVFQWKGAAGQAFLRIRANW
ncbi:MAG: hypothetical protein ACI8T1_000873 [Verrucomicrobiales bacterium]